MKVLFFLKNENFMAPLGLLTIAAVAKKNGHESFLCEINARDPFLAIDEVKPDIIAYSSATGEAKHYFSLNRAVKGKHPGIFTIMGGAHPTFFHESLKETTLDALCVGEGEGAMADVLSALSEKKELGPIDNIVTKNHRSL